MDKFLPHCDCPESSEALGLKVGKAAWKKDFHRMTPTQSIRKNYCKFCGNHVFYKQVKNKEEKNENFRS